MIERLADACVARLTARCPGIKVEHFPDAPNRYPWAAARQTLLVGYESDTFGALESMAPLGQPCVLEFSVTVLARSLRGSLGIATLLEAAQAALFGWRPTLPGDDEVETPIGCGPITMVRRAFVREQDGVWQYVLIFRSDYLAVAEDPALASVSLTEVHFVEPAA